MTHPANDDTAQKWYISKIGNYVGLIPECATGMTLDVKGAILQEGTNIEIFTKNHSAAQNLKIIQVDELKISSHPANLSAANGSAVKFSVKADGEGLEYQWQSRDSGSSSWVNSTLTGNRTDTLSTEAAAGINGTQYRCVVKDGLGRSLTSNSATLTVTFPASLLIASNPSSVTKNEGETAQFKVTANGSGLTYQWQAKTAGSSSWVNSSLSGSQTDTLQVAAYTSRNGNQYRCIVKDYSGKSVTSNAATLTVKSAAASLSITSQPSSITKNAGETAQFKVTASGSGLTYQWQAKTAGSSSWVNSSLSGSQTSTLQVAAYTSRNGNQYRCIVKDSSGKSVTSNAATLTVSSAVSLSITSQPSGIIKNAGETAQFKVTASGSGLTYQWQAKTAGSSSWVNSSLSGSQTSTLQVAALTSRNGNQYRCIVKDSSGKSVTSNAATLTVKSSAASLSITSQPTSLTKNAGETAQFKVTASGSGLTYQWQAKTAGSSSWVNSSLAGSQTSTLQVGALTSRNGNQYRCIVKDSSGKSVTSSVATLTVSSAVSLSITSQPSGVIKNAGETAQFKVTASGSGLTYQWQAKTAGSSSWVNSSLTGSQTSTLQVGALTSRNGNQYRCIVKDSSGKSVTSNAATLTVVSAASSLSITSQPSSVTKGAGETAQFKVTASGSGLTYQWQAKTAGSSSWVNSSLTGSQTSTLQVGALTSRNGNQYRCIVKDSSGKSVTTNTATLIVLSASSLSITSQPSGIITNEGETAQFKVTANGSGLTYQWQAKTAGSSSWVNSSLTGSQTSTLQVAAYASRNGNQYRCIVKDSSGKSITSNEVTLTVISNL